MNRLNKYLTHNGISQRFFARKIGCSPNNLNNLAKGRTCPNLRLAYKIEQFTSGLVTMKSWVEDEMEERDKLK